MDIESATEQKSLTSGERFDQLFATMDEAFCICEIVFDQNENPTDYRFLEVNPVFEETSGLSDAVGKCAYELVPGLEASWLKIFSRCALQGEQIRSYGPLV